MDGNLMIRQIKLTGLKCYHENLLSDCLIICQSRVGALMTLMHEIKSRITCHNKSSNTCTSLFNLRCMRQIVINWNANMAQLATLIALIFTSAASQVTSLGSTLDCGKFFIYPMRPYL